jgi:hypothetical protein
MNSIQKLSDFYFVHGQIYIIADSPGAEEWIKEHPDIPAMYLSELKLLHS